jgi:TPR repeat protein
MKVILLSLALLAPALPVQGEGPFSRYLLASANQGEAESQFILGLAYRDGWEGTIKSGSTAAKWRDLAAELGDQRPSLVFGLLQKEEDRIMKDGAEAVRWLSVAAGQGDDYARVILGDMLLEGDGVPADWRGGTEWIRKSANAGFAPAQFRLGLIYMVGDESTPRNEIEALAWFIVAAESGSKTAQAYRDERTQLLGRDVARLAIKRSRTLLVMTKGPRKGSGFRDPS